MIALGEILESYFRIQHGSRRPAREITDIFTRGFGFRNPIAVVAGAGVPFALTQL